MYSHVRLLASLLAVGALLFGSGNSAWAQDQPHVVSLADLKKDAAQAAETRKSDEEAVRNLFSSEEGQKALKSAHLDYQRVDKAVAN
jgi:hypothetical protein